MADELAKVLTIPDDVTTQMGKVIEKINEIENASNKMATTVNQAWKQLANGDVNLFLQKLASTQSAMTAISSTNLQVDTKSISNAATDAEKMAGAMGKVAQSAQNIGLEDKLNRQISDAITRYKELQQQVERYHKLEAQGRTTKLSSIRNAQAEKEMRILEAQIQVWQSNVNQIKQANSALKEQVAFLNGTNLEMQRSEHLLSRMTAFYKEQEKSSLASANADQKKATDAEKQYNSLQSRLTTLQKKYDEIRMAEPFEGQEKAVEGYKTEISRVERELKRLEREFPNIKTFSDQTWDAKRILNYVAQVEAVQKRLRKQYDDTANAYREANLKTLNTPEGALNFASSANTYARQVKAIQFLENAYKSLGKTEADVAKKNEIVRAMRELRESVREADEQMGKFKDSARGLFNYSEQLGRAFSLLFSVSAIKNYIRQIREVTAEFELQRVALGSLLQSQDKANELFGQITNLAVRSPFNIKELNKYTKQLAAYNIQYENLFDTTKMLADVSAGLGVDIGRLILAFGQVKAATVLRGTEVRQFTEAGFGILGELAKYYTELEGKLVSVGDVQDRITKKMVKFADVEEIFKRVTSAGGMFYNMQEKMADTLYGKWSNLTDRIDLMLNEIGQNNMGILNLLVDVSAGLADNWEAVAVALQLAIPALISFKVQSAMAAKELTWIGEQSIFATVSVKGLGAAFKSALGPVGLLLIALEAGYAIFNHLADATERNDEAIKDYNRNVATLTKTQQAFADIEKMERKANETDKDFAKRQYDAKLASLISLREELAKMGFDEENLPDISLVTSDNIDQQINDLQKAGKAYVDFSHKFRDVIGNMANGVEWLGVLGENVKSDAEDLVRSASKMNASVSVEVENIKNAFLAVKDQIEPDTFNRLFEGLTQKEGEDAIQYAERLKDILEELSQPYSPLTQSLGMDATYVKQWASDALNTVKGFRDDIREMEFETDKFTNKLIKNYYGSRERMQEDAQSNPIAFVTAIRDELARQQIDGFAQDVMAKKIVIDLIPNFDWSNMSGTPQLAQWKKDLLAMPSLKGLITEKDLENIASFDEYVSSLQSETKKAKEENERYGNTIKDNNGEAAKQFKEAQDNNTKTIKANEAIAKALGINLDLTKKEQKQAKNRNDYLEESVSLIKKMKDEYEKALDSMGKTAAKTDINTRYSSLLSNLADKAGMDGTAFIANLSFDTSGIISALQKVAEAAAKAGATEAEQAAREAIAEIQGEDIKIKVKANVDNFERDLDNVLGQYQLGKELSKLGLGKELTESLFNFESIDLDTVKSFVGKFKTAHTDSNGEIAKDYKETYEKALKEVTDLENKELQERLKSYHKYLKQSMSDAVAIKLEEARQLDEINKMEIDAATKAQLREGVKRETSEKYDKAKWEEFKDSDMYIQMFEDLDYMSTATLQRLRNRLTEIRDSLHDLSPESLKEIQAQFDKIDEVITQRNPFKELAKSLKAVNDLRKQGRTREVIEEEIGAYDTKLQQTQQEIQLLEKYIGLQQRGLSLDNLTNAEKAKLVQYEGMQGLELKENLDSLKEYYDILKLILRQEEAELHQWTDLGKDLDGAVKKMRVWGEQWDEVAETAKEALDMMGVESDSTAHTLIDMGTSLKDIGLSAIQQAVNFKAMGIASNSALGIIGWVAIALQAVVTIMSALFKLHDKRLENQIEQELDSIDDLVKKYEKLEEAIDAAYSSRDYDSNYRDAINNLDAQNAALRRAMAAEEDKKKTDAERIKEWEEQERENLEKIAQLRAEAIESYGGFGTSDSLKSAAEDFVSAWMDAFNETESGLDALSDKMDEWLNNAIQRQLLMRLSDQYITPLLEQFDAMFSETSDQGRIMTKEEIEAWKRLYEQNSKEFDEKAKAYLQALDIKPTGAESELSGLQRGIEGVTETTAQALEALLNSMRYYVSDSNNLLRQFYMSFISADETMNPMLYELKQHTTLLNAIHSLLNSTTKMTNNNGRALKVLMM